MDKNNHDNGNKLPCLYSGRTECMFNLTFHIFGLFFFRGSFPGISSQKICMSHCFGMLPGTAEDHSARPGLPPNVLPAFAKLWEMTVWLCRVWPSKRSKGTKLRSCSADCRKILWCGPLVKYVEKRKAVGYRYDSNL